MGKTAMGLGIAGWGLLTAGIALWSYGYFFAGGHASFIDWAAAAPAWISGYLPNTETETGVLLMFLGVIPLYWRRRG